MRGISSLIALLLIIGLVVGLSVFVTNLVLTQVSTGTERPTHLQLLERRIVPVSPHEYKLEITYYNPTDKEFTVTLRSANLRQGSSSMETLTLVDYRSIVLKPGDTGKLEAVLRATNFYQNGVIIIEAKVMVGTKYYIDVIPIPFK